jgi:hypothetical protein
MAVLKFFFDDVNPCDAKSSFWWNRSSPILATFRFRRNRWRMVEDGGRWRRRRNVEERGGRWGGGGSRAADDGGLGG